MPGSDASLILVAAFVMALIVLSVLSREISLRIQTVIYYITRSQDMAVLGLFLILMPGVYVHESAHWLMAKLVGLRTGKFRVWPQRKGKMIGMGQVAVEQKDVWRDSLVGMAPLVIGSILVTLIGRHVFAAYSITDALAAGNLGGALAAFRLSLGAADSLLWAYLLFALANAMMPSASDREPLTPVLLYISLAVGFYIVLGMPLSPFATALNSLRPLLTEYVSALLFVLILDLFVLGVLWVVSLLFARRYR